MVTFLFPSICIALALVGAIGLWIFLGAAFYGEKQLQESVRPTWCPPYVSGNALRDWAAAEAEQFARRELGAGEISVKAPRVAIELGRHATESMLPLARTAALERIVTCPAEVPGSMFITPLEALALAADLRERFPGRELERVAHTARANASRLAAASALGAAAPVLACPLQGSDRVCCAYDARPWECRSRHAAFVAHSIGQRKVGTNHEQTVIEGLNTGVARALRSAGRDANRYELNHALIVALETPNAAEAWAAGEPVFGSCPRDL